MKVISHTPRARTTQPPAETATARPVETLSQPVRWLGVLTRLCLGWVFLWAFLDKTFGLGHDTKVADAWIRGGSPTYGFLHFAATGPFAGAYRGIAGAAWADWLFMIGLAAIGIGLMFAVALRLAAWAGAVMLVLMWAAVLPPANNPFMDYHLIYAMVLLLIPLLHTETLFGFGRWWSSLPVISRHRALQ